MSIGDALEILLRQLDLGDQPHLRDELKRLAQIFGEDPSQDLDKLHPDLVPWLTFPGPLGGAFLNHPLLQDISVWNVKVTNARYDAKRQRLRELLAEDSLEVGLWLFERPYRLGVFEQWLKSSRLSLDRGRQLFPDVWIDTELPEQELVKARYRQLFQKLGFMSDDEVTRFESLPAKLLVFRGADARWVRGLSWSTELRVARMFAHRFTSQGGSVWKALIPRTGVLAVFRGRNESEVVVNPALLEEVELVDA